MTITLKNKKVKVKPIKDKQGNAGFFIPANEFNRIFKPSSKKKAKRTRSVFEDVKEALREVELAEQGKIKLTDAQTWLQSLKTPA